MEYFLNHFESILNDHQRKVAEGGKNDEGRNKEMPISRRLEGLRSSRLDHSMQKFKAVLFRRVPRPDSPDLAGKITKHWGRDRRRRAKSPKAEKLAGGGQGFPWGSQGFPWGSPSNAQKRRALRRDAFEHLRGASRA